MAGSAEGVSSVVGELVQIVGNLVGQQDPIFLQQNMHGEQREGHERPFNFRKSTADRHLDTG